MDPKQKTNGSLLFRNSFVSNGNGMPEEDMDERKPRLDVYNNVAFGKIVNDGKETQQTQENVGKSNIVSGSINKFMETTSAHGFYQILIRKSIIAKLFWMAILITGFCGLGIHLSTLVTKYLNYDYDEITDELVLDPSFPDVTVCNMDAISSDRYWENGGLSKVADFWELSSIWEDLMRNATHPFDFGVLSTTPGLLSNWPEDFRRNSSYRFQDLIVTCTYNMELCNQSDFIVFEHSEFFNCYTYHYNGTNVQSGPEAGLTLLLYIGDQADTLDKTFTAYSPILGSRGWRVTVHEASTLPAVFDEGFDILPGVSTSVSLKANYISRLPAPYSSCVGDTFLRGTDSEYKLTPTDCRKLCLGRTIERECKCVSPEVNPYLYPGSQYCLTYNKSNPMQIFEQRFCEEQIRKKRASQRICDELTECNKECNWRCDEIEYSIKKTTSIFPTREVMSWFYTIYIYGNVNRDKLLAWHHFINPNRTIIDRNKTAEDYLYRPMGRRRSASVVTDEMANWISSSFARVNIYFEDVTVLQTKQVPSYEWTDLLADIGGILGLWVGVSVITIFEFCTLLLTLVSLLFNPENNKKLNGKLLKQSKIKSESSQLP